MKKIITAVATIGFLFCGAAQAEKTITFTDINFAMGRIWLIPAPVKIGTETYYTPLIFSAITKSVSPGGFIIHKTTSIVIGPLRKTPYTLKEKMNPALWNLVGPKLRAAFIDAGKQTIGINVSE